MVICKFDTMHHGPKSKLKMHEMNCEKGSMYYMYLDHFIERQRYSNYVATKEAERKMAELMKKMDDEVEWGKEDDEQAGKNDNVEGDKNDDEEAGMDDDEEAGKNDNVEGDQDDYHDDTDDNLKDADAEGEQDADDEDSEYNFF